MKAIKEVKYYNIPEMAFMLGISEKSVRNRIKESGKYEVVHGEVRKLG